MDWLVSYDPRFYSLYYLKTEWGWGGREKLYRDDNRAQFNRPTGANPGLAAMTTHMLHLQLTQD